MALAQVGDFGRPVIHLGVDVAGVFAVPGGFEAVVPDALEIGGLAARTAAGDEQVAAILKYERGQAGIVHARRKAQAFISGQQFLLATPQIERNPAEQTLIILEVRLSELCPVSVSGFSQRLGAPSCWISGRVLKTSETGRGGQHQYGGIGVANLNCAICDCDRPALGAHLQAGFKLERI